tara:strand:+ start:1917 stop:2174 length:258 start_codon:yes stop_codon:yes gene_type:complete
MAYENIEDYIEYVQESIDYLHRLISTNGGYVHTSTYTMRLEMDQLAGTLQQLHERKNLCVQHTLIEADLPERIRHIADDRGGTNG